MIQKRYTRLELLKMSMIAFMMLFVLVINAQQKTNVLFIAIDDLKPTIGAYGDETVVSPNMDALANQGVVFTNAHCQQAVCGPSRASIMTGMRPDFTGVWDLKTRMRDVNPDILAMPEYFKNQGYATVAVGKIYDPRCVDKQYDGPSWTIPYKESAQYTYPEEYGEPGLSYYALPERKEMVAKYTAEAKEKGEKNIHGYVSKRFKPSVECADVSDDAYIDGQITNNAIRYMKELGKSKKPFFLAVGYKRPHLPFAAPKKYWDLYKREDIKLAEYPHPVKDGVDLAYHNSGELFSYTDIPDVASYSDLKTMQLPEDKQRELIHGYYAAVSYIDALLGRLMDELKASGLDKNTVIVLWGDHGWHLGDHSMWCKHSNFEQATRVPLIFAGPKVKSGRYDLPAEFIDVFPTLCELSGNKTPDHLQGVSLVPAMNDNSVMVKPVAVSQFSRGKKMGYSIRSERFRLTLWMKDGWKTFMPLRGDEIVDGELYDYKVDALETTNFYNNAKYEKVKKQMVQIFIDYVVKQNEELKNAGSQSRKAVKDNSAKKANIVIGSSFDENWKVISRRGAEATFSVENNALVADIKKLGERKWDLQMEYKGKMELKAGQTLVIKLMAEGNEMAFNLGPVNDYRVTRKISGGKGKKMQVLQFPINETGAYPVKISFTGTGKHFIKDFNVSVQ